MTVVDVGAGTGYFLPHLSRAVGAKGTVLALDVEADMVRHMRERADRAKLENVRAAQVAPNDPGLAPASVHRILIVDTWHHIADRVAYGKRLRASLAPDGMVYVVDFKLDSAKGPPRSHRIAPEQVAEELRQSGMDASILPVALPDQYMVGGRASR